MRRAQGQKPRIQILEDRTAGGGLGAKGTSTHSANYLQLFVARKVSDWRSWALALPPAPCLSLLLSSLMPLCHHCCCCCCPAGWRKSTPSLFQLMLTSRHPSLTAAYLQGWRACALAGTLSPPSYSALTAAACFLPSCRLAHVSDFHFDDWYSPSALSPECPSHCCCPAGWRMCPTSILVLRKQRLSPAGCLSPPSQVNRRVY